MSINLKKLQAIARRKLKLKGYIEWTPVPKSQLALHRIGKEYLSTRTNDMTHTISYTDVSSLAPADVFHEMCKVKLNEMGFDKIEAGALEAMRDCCANDPKYIKDASSAVAIVLETYTNSILFRLFPEESKMQREQIVSRFESSDAVTTLHTQLGFWGTAGISYHLVASDNSGIQFPQNLVEKAIARASGGEEIRREYDVISAVLKELPRLDLERERMTEQESMKIVETMLRLFAAKTGLDCLATL
jgi:hypothetical protein